MEQPDAAAAAVASWRQSWRGDLALHRSGSAFVLGQVCRGNATRQCCRLSCPQGRVPAVDTRRCVRVNANGNGNAENEYARIDAMWYNRLFMWRFGEKMRDAVNARTSGATASLAGVDVASSGYDAIVQLALCMLQSERRRGIDTEESSLVVLRSLFPSWLAFLFRRMFSTPFPVFSERMNAWVTSWATVWLMGPNTTEDGGMTIAVEKCRYLEQTGCVGVCVNSCKRPTQRFFAEELGVRCTIEPNYDDLSCKFKFGIEPTSQDDLDACNTPCLSICGQNLQSGTDSPDISCARAWNRDVQRISATRHSNP
ncbi:Beta-carotene isomerase D27, chloroplastic [Porphyridium purpureum]|uniref:Beta-carotene isomerase D27, chloroplastic n=1 Tax=Porphyridium purpureum TaxID=35688 RepID=A0A5J4Z540_PORPP|nr:Beta-carotene isomerase D27, chloroplastic [Porphyridium purpureum]|eukprot:POR6125..scf295_1